MRVLWPLLLSLSAHADDAPWSRQAFCDVPAADLASVPSADVDACEALCRERADCAGFTFVSGWDRCKLEADASRRVTVHLVSAALRLVDGVRTLDPPTRDADHSGKDLAGGPWTAADASACAATCVGEPACVGYVFVEGYATCWLKATEGSVTPKTFTCGVRPAAEAAP
jgi:hypothetical protein